MHIVHQIENESGEFVNETAVRPKNHIPVEGHNAYFGP